MSVCSSASYRRARYGVRGVAILNFWIGMVLLVKCFFLILNSFYSYYNDDTDFYIISRQTKEELTIFCYMSTIFVWLYINYGLKEATYDHKVHKISRWLTITVIFLSLYILAFIYISAKHRFYTESVFLSIFIVVVHVSEICVVKYFYNKELENAVRRADVVAAVVNQCSDASNGSANAVVNSPTAIPNQVFQTVVGQPPAFQTVVGQPPAFQTVVGQPPSGPHYQHHQTAMAYHPAQHQVAAGAHVAGEQQRSLQQEYYNPPAYLPSSYEPRTANSPIKVVYCNN